MTASHIPAFTETFGRICNSDSVTGYVLSHVVMCAMRNTTRTLQSETLVLGPNLRKI